MRVVSIIGTIPGLWLLQRGRLQATVGRVVTFPSTVDGTPPRIEHAAAECRGSKPVVHGKVRHILIHHVRERPHHALLGACRGFEEERRAFDVAYHPRVLSVDARLVTPNDPADIELGRDADFAQLAPRPQREVLAVTTA